MNGGASMQTVGIGQSFGGAGCGRPAAGHGIYVASRASSPERPAMWRALRDAGWHITSSWIDEAGEGQTASFTELWGRIEREIRGSLGLIVYAEPEDFPLKGAYLEAGIAIGAGLPVAVVMPKVELEARSDRPVGSWIRHPGVTICRSLEEARSFIEASPEATAKTALASQPAVDVERLIRECLPGGPSCDPQAVADAMREWFRAQREATAARESTPGGSDLRRQARRFLTELADKRPRRALDVDALRQFLEPIAAPSDVEAAINSLIRTAWEWGASCEVDSVRWGEAGDSHNTMWRDRTSQAASRLQVSLASSPAAPAAERPGRHPAERADVTEEPWTEAQIDGITAVLRDHCGPATADRLRRLIAGEVRQPGDSGGDGRPWSKSEQEILAIVREYSGDDGVDDHDGVDLPAEVRECLGILSKDAAPMAVIGPAAVRAGWRGETPVEDFVCGRLAAATSLPVVLQRLHDAVGQDRQWKTSGTALGVGLAMDEASKALTAARPVFPSQSATLPEAGSTAATTAGGPPHEAGQPGSTPGVSPGVTSTHQ